MDINRLKYLKPIENNHAVLLTKENNFSANNCFFAVSKASILLQYCLVGGCIIKPDVYKKRIFQCLFFSGITV